MANTYSAGTVTAYGAAVRGGYTGTYAEWCQDMAQLGANIAEVRQKATAVAEDAAQVALDKQAAVDAKGAAETAEDNAEAWATGGSAGTPSSTNNALYYSGQAAASQTAAAAAEDAAEAWATGGAEGTPSATNNAKYYSEQAAASETAAGLSQTAAETAEDNAEAWATGGSAGTPSATNNAKYYSEQAQASAASADGAAAQAMIAPVEATTTAAAAHAVGDYFRYDGDLYITTAAIAVGDTIAAGTNCQAAVLGDDVSELKSALYSVEGEALQLTPELSVNGIIRADNGNVYSTTPYGKCTDFIDIHGFDTIVWNTYDGDSSVARVAFYDASRSYLSSLTVSTGTSGTIDISGAAYASACYVRMSYYSSVEDFTGFDGRIYLSTGLAKRFEDISEDITSLSQNVEELNNTTESITENTIIVFPELTINGIIDATSGERANTQYGKCTDFVSVGNYDTLEWNTYGGDETMARVAFYDLSHTFLSNLVINAGTSGTVDLSNATYNSVAFVRWSYYSSEKDFENFAGRLYLKNSLADHVDYLINKYKLANPINVLIFGDSITDCADITIVNDKTTQYNLAGMSYYVKDGETIRYMMWPKIFEKYVDCAEIRNYAKSGASYKDNPNASDPRYSLSYQITVALNDLDNPNGAFTVNDFNPDVIFFALGTNDGIPNDTPDSAEAKIVTGATGIDIDSTLNALDRSKFCEAALWAYLNIRKYFPTALVMCELPLQRTDNEYPLGDIRTALTKIAQKYGGAIIIDGAYESGIVAENNKTNGTGDTLKDTTHPNDKGQNMLARLMISKFQNYYVPFDNMNI